MSTATAPKTLPRAVDAAATALREQRAVLARWESDRDDAARELTRLQDGAGAAVLDDADPADLAQKMTTLRDRVGIAEKAIEAQAPRIRVAEVVYLTAEADALEPDVEAARAVLAAHQAKVDVLLGQLRDLEGDFIPELRLIELQRSLDVHGTGRSWRVPKSHAMHQVVTRAERRVAVVRELAAGRDPQDLIGRWLVDEPVTMEGDDLADFYPPCLWRPGALITAPVQRGRVSRARRWVAELEDLQEQLQAQVDGARGVNLTTLATIDDQGHNLEATVDAAGRPFYKTDTYGHLSEDERHQIALVRRAYLRLQELPRELEQARADLAALTDASC